MQQVRFDHPGLVGIAAFAIGSILAVAGGIGAYGFRDRLDRTAQAEALTGGLAARAPALLRRYGCSGCHEIPGIPGADGKVGGPLRGLRQRIYIAGVVPNTPANLAEWIVLPQAFSPRTAMPATGIDKAGARDIAAYLYAN